jgi:glyoxylase-like metal-dependent hydrolase (beta-lactamase superfamily II)
MLRRCAILLIGLSLPLLALWLGAAAAPLKPEGFDEVVPGVYRLAGSPTAYVLIEGESAIVIDAPARLADARAPLARCGVKTIDFVLLTHHHRDTCEAATAFLKAGVPVRAAKASADWLAPDKVAKYWQDSIPLRNSRTAYLVHPTGLAGIDTSLVDGQTISWKGWTIQVVATPGHSADHVAYAARRKEAEPPIVFCGDAFTAPGKLWSPYTTDWDHWTDLGLKPTGQSLRKLAALKPALLCPAHGPTRKEGCEETLLQTAKGVEEAGFLKSFERFTKERLGKAPAYAYLAKEQAMTNGSLPWSQLSPHLYVTGNTFVLVSKDNACLVVDPWGKRSVDQVMKLRADKRLGAVEVVMFSHAHYDHYDGVYDLPGREGYQVWSLDLVADPLERPLYYRAPFLDHRPIKFDKRPRDRESLAWREYRFKFHHFPGQSWFTMAVETAIDGKRCLFTADNFFHQDMFSGSGGWMGLNRSWPSTYASSAQKVLDLKPEWVLAEHGGPFEFNAEDFRRRVEWGKAAARAIDSLCVSGNHRIDWDPHRVRVEPLVHSASAGESIKAVLAIDNAGPRKEELEVMVMGRDGKALWSEKVETAAGRTSRRDISFRLPPDLAAGRHVFALRALRGTEEDGSDAFVVVDVK